MCARLTPSTIVWSPANHLDKLQLTWGSYVELLQIILIKYCDTYVRATNTINYCVEPRQSFGQAATNLRIICGAAANNFDKILWYLCARD
jgi:hypothetical protein